MRNYEKTASRLRYVLQCSLCKFENFAIVYDTRSHLQVQPLIQNYTLREYFCTIEFQQLKFFSRFMEEKNDELTTLTFYVLYVYIYIEDARCRMRMHLTLAAPDFAANLQSNYARIYLCDRCIFWSDASNVSRFMYIPACLKYRMFTLKRTAMPIAPSNGRKEIANEINFSESIGYHNDECEINETFDNRLCFTIENDFRRCFRYLF